MASLHGRAKQQMRVGISARLNQGGDVVREARVRCPRPPDAHTDEESCGYSHDEMTDSSPAGHFSPDGVAGPACATGCAEGRSLTEIGAEIGGRRRSQITIVRPCPDGQRAPHSLSAHASPAGARVAHGRCPEHTPPITGR